MSDVLDSIRRALGRTHSLSSAPVPPAIEEPITRLVHSELGLSELFTRMAEANKMHVTAVGPDDLLSGLIEFLRANACMKLALPASVLLDGLSVVDGLAAAGLDVRRWDEISLDELYDFDCGITDVYAAVAETGSLVIRAAAGHGRALSLVPPIHVAIVEPRNLLPDLVDLFEKLSTDNAASNITLITGPSKTADIEMNLVTGVHGPRLVHIFLLG